MLLHGNMEIKEEWLEVKKKKIDIITKYTLAVLIKMQIYHQHFITYKNKKIVILMQIN